MLTKLLNRAIFFFYWRPQLEWLLIFGLLLGGTWAQRMLDTEAYPEFAPPTVRVITIAPGKGAEEIESLITIPLEKELNAIPKEVNLRSISILGLSVISIVFEDGTPSLQARQQVLERISQADIPDYAHPALDPDAGSTGEIYRYTVDSSYFSPMSRKAIEDWQLERAFKQIPGVIDVVSFGGPTKNFQVNIDPQKLVSYGITLTQVFQAIQNSNGTTGGNYIENNGSAYVVRGIGLLTNIDDIERVVVSSTRDGTPVRIKDVARVDIGPGVRLGQFGNGDDDDAIMGIVLMRRGENPSKVVQRLYEKLPLIRQSLPNGVKLVKLYDRQELVQKTLNTVFHNVIEGILLIVTVLVVFLYDFTCGLIASLAIPLSLCLGTLLLLAFHIPANLLSLGAIDFGIIVHGAVVMVENAFAKLASLPEGATIEEKRELVLLCAQQVGAPILFAITIIMAAFLPIFSFDAVAGKLFRPLAFTMCFYLVGALVSALFIVPSLISSFVVRQKVSHRESPVVRLAQFFYKPTLGWSLKFPWLVVVGALCSLALTVCLAGNVGSEFLPALDEGNIWLRATVLPTSVSLEESVRIARRLRQIVAQFPEVRMVTSQTGCPDDGTDPNLFSNIELFVDLIPADQWRPQFHQNKAELIKALHQRLLVIPNLMLNFSQYIQDNVDEAVAGAKSMLAVKIYGPDVTVLQGLGDQIAHQVASVPGLVDVANNQQLGQPQYQVAIDRDQASRYGVNVSDVQNLIETAIGGKVATRLIDGEKRFPVLVRLAKKYRNTERALDEILIDPPGPISAVPLSQMAKIKYGYGAAYITRENNSRVMYVRINVRGRDLGSAVKDAQEKIKENIKIPEGYMVVWAGQYEFQQQANGRLLIVVPCTLLLIYVILLVAFSSHKHAFLVMCGVPLAWLGGVSALLISHTYFSISAAIGFIALSGLAVQNGVILISYINQLREEDCFPLYEATLRGSIDRMRPILMTGTVAMLGLVPAATSTGIGSQSQRPFAIVIIGGLITATLLTLIVLPAIYMLLESHSERDRNITLTDPVLTRAILPFLAVMVVSSSLTGCTSIFESKAFSDMTGKKAPLVEHISLAKQELAAQKKKEQPVEVTVDKEQAQEIGLSVTPVSIGLVDKTVESTGRVGPNSELTTLVSTPSAGRAIEVKARLGDVVPDGQIMAVMKSEQIGQVQSDLLQNALQSKADIKQQEVQLKLSHITFDRESRLWKEQVSAQADLQAAENQLEKDEANLAALKAKSEAIITTAQQRLTLLGAPPDSARKVLAEKKIDPYVVIRAPRGGLVIERNINPGELNDGSKPLFTLANLSEVWLFADIFEKDIASVKKEQEAVVTIDSLPDRTFPAQIIWVGDSISVATRTLPIRANVSNPHLLLKPGMFARIKVDVGQAKVLRVPRSAVIDAGDKKLTFVQRRGGDVFEEREVVTGAFDARGIEILSGVSLGEKVVSRGGTALLGTSMKSTQGSD